MISDDGLYRLAIFLGSLAMLLIILYHFLEVNSKDDERSTPAGEKGTSKASAQGQGQGRGKVGAR